MDIVGDHGGLPIEGLSLSHCGNWLASCSHDEHIRFWDVTDLESEQIGKSVKARPSKKKYVPKAEVMKREQFFNDLVEDMKSSDEETAGEGTTKESEDDNHSNSDIDDDDDDDSD